MVITLAGRRVDEKDAKEERFPLKNANKVSNELRAKFKALNPGALVSSAACGADLIALVAAHELGIRRRIILPFPPPKFRKTSVIDRPGNSTWNWGEIFDFLAQKAEESNDLVVAPPSEDETAAYATTNGLIISEGIKLASKEIQRDDTDENHKNILALIVWEGNSRGDDDLTAEFADKAKAKGITVEQVYTVNPNG